MLPVVFFFFYNTHFASIWRDLTACHSRNKSDNSQTVSCLCCLCRCLTPALHGVGGVGGYARTQTVRVHTWNNETDFRVYITGAEDNKREIVWSIYKAVEQAEDKLTEIFSHSARNPLTCCTQPHGARYDKVPQVSSMSVSGSVWDRQSAKYVISRCQRRREIQQIFSHHTVIFNKLTCMLNWNIILNYQFGCVGMWECFSLVCCLYLHLHSDFSFQVIACTGAGLHICTFTTNQVVHKDS